MSNIYDLKLIKDALNKEKEYFKSIGLGENELAPEIMVFTVSDDEKQIIDTKLVPRKEFYDYIGNYNEYVLDMIRDTGWWDIDYQLQPVADKVEYWNRGRQVESRFNENSDDTLEIQFVKIDDFNRPVFKPVEKERKYFLVDLDHLFEFDKKEKEILDFYKEFEDDLNKFIVFKGYSADAEPMGNELNKKLKLVRK